MIILKSLRMLTVGLIAGIFLATTASTFAEGETSKISAYLREGFTFKVKGEPITLKNTPIVYQDTTYLPVRELAGILGYDVGFEDNTITLDPKTPTEAEQSIEKDVTNVTTTTEPQEIDLSSGDWIEFNVVTSKYKTVWGGEQGNMMTRDDGETLTFYSPAAAAAGEFTIETSKGPLRAYKKAGGFVYVSVPDLKAFGFYPQ